MIMDNWNEQAFNAIKKVATEQAEFTPDDVWATGLQKPVEARALGGVMRRARTEGLIEKTGRVQPTTQSASHRADIAIWCSLIYKNSTT